ncbi:hypothetical protein K438DRAFT_611125 [Mycena galopus ATCC 62051]|nr:hypothetical protein K438DRAFT_611125 [Mycena galopus ATCC 62051]
MHVSFFATGQVHLQILSEIYGHWVKVDRDAPWKAALVCRLWRTAVMSTPKACLVNICFPVEKVPKRGPKTIEKVPCDEDESDVEPYNVDSEDDCVEEDDDEGNEDATDGWKPRPLALWLSRARESELFIYMKIGFAPRVDWIILLSNYSFLISRKSWNWSSSMHALVVSRPNPEHAPQFYPNPRAFNAVCEYKSTELRSCYRRPYRREGLWGVFEENVLSAVLDLCLLGSMSVASTGRQINWHCER